MKVKILKDLIRRNIMGYDIKTLTAKEDEIVEIDAMRGKTLIEKGLAVEVPEEGAQETSEEGSEGSDKTPPVGSEGSGAVTTDPPSGDSDEYFTLDAKTITRLRGLGKDEIEAILRNYSVEVDKRHTLPAIQEELIETISTSMPDEATTRDDIMEYMVSFYNDKFGILLDKANYSEDKLSELTADMGALLKGALSDEDS